MPFLAICRHRVHPPYICNIRQYGYQNLRSYQESPDQVEKIQFNSSEISQSDFSDSVISYIVPLEGKKIKTYWQKSLHSK